MHKHAAMQKKPGRMRKAAGAAGKFFRNALIGGIMLGASLGTAKTLKAEPSYRMPVVTAERPHVQKKDYYSDSIKGLVPELVSAGIFSSEQEAMSAIKSSNFLPYLKSILNSDSGALKNAFANKVYYFDRTNFTDLQATLSGYWPDDGNSWISWNEALSLTVSPTRINASYLYAERQVFAPTEQKPTTDTVDNYSQTYTTRYVPTFTIGSSIRIWNYDLAVSYSPKTAGLIGDNKRLQITNCGERFYVDLDYFLYSKFGSQKADMDLGFSTNLGIPAIFNTGDFARIVMWVQNASNSPTFQFGAQLSPNALFPQEWDSYANTMLYSMLRNQSGKIEAISGVRADFAIWKNLVGVANIEYNSSASNYQIAPKPSGWTYRFAIAVME